VKNNGINPYIISEIKFKTKYVLAYGNLFATSFPKLSERIAEKLFSKIGGETAAKFFSKIGEKTSYKIIGKNIPGVGFIIGLGFGIWRCYRGEIKKAVLEVVSGAISSIPGGGIAYSLPFDLYFDNWI
jgi:hypothetical protein